jgi:hypothetical protein
MRKWVSGWSTWTDSFVSEGFELKPSRFLKSGSRLNGDRILKPDAILHRFEHWILAITKRAASNALKSVDL